MEIIVSTGVAEILQSPCFMAVFGPGNTLLKEFPSSITAYFNYVHLSQVLALFLQSIPVS